jgi:hypothetical protein
MLARDSKGRFLKSGARRKNPVKALPSRWRKNYARIRGKGVVNYPGFGKAKRITVRAKPGRSSRTLMVYSNPRRRYGRRRNPVGSMGLGSIGSQLMGAVKGASGALVVNAAYAYIPMPGMLKSGRMAYVTKAALALILGKFGRKIFGGMAGDMAKGALTVITAQALNEVVAQVSGGRLNVMGDYPSNVDFPQDLNEYVGYTSPAENAGMGSGPFYTGYGLAGMGEYVE